MSPFKFCDIRGVYPEEVNENLAHKLGRAVAALAEPGAVAVAGDLRPSTQSLKDALIAGLLAGGRRVLDMGSLPTPAYYFEKARLGVTPGVMVTGSHNPPKYNGFKPQLGRFPISQADLTRLEILSARRWEPSGAGACVRVGGPDAYAKALSDRFRGMAPIRVAVDAGNGSLWELAPKVFRAVGCDVIEVYCEPDGTFPNRAPNPADPENLRAVSEAVRSRSVELGVAFDGDGDRVAFLTSDGKVVEPDQMLAVVASELLRESPGRAVIHDLKSSRVVPAVVQAAGGVALWERSGHTSMKSRMIRERALFGGEVSGHFFFEELAGGDDGLFAALLVASLLPRWGGLRKRLDSLPRYVTLPEIRLPYPEGRKQVIDTIRAGLDGEADLTLTDGVRADWPECWGIVRASVTEPVLALRFEGTSEQALLEGAQRFLVLLPEPARAEAEGRLKRLLEERRVRGS
ncbi:MAG: phosphomannomutase/phosphoglucomutase [Fimbriimonadia bacterium]|jgi:phosphomannomutase/phosphoglucomutase